jgi:hypothetical protein
MSTTTKPKLTINDAAKHAGLVLELDDLKRLGIALAYAASEEIEHNTRFATQVRTVYEALAATVSPGTGGRGRSGGSGTKAPVVDLVPMKRIEGYQIDLAAPLDPYFLYEVYGAQQLPLALNLFSATRLKEAVILVQERNPGTKPSGRSSKPALVEYIIRYVDHE